MAIMSLLSSDEFPKIEAINSVGRDSSFDAVFEWWDRAIGLRTKAAGLASCAQAQEHLSCKRSSRGVGRLS